MLACSAVSVFRLPTCFVIEAQAEQKYYETKEGTAKSVIFIFLPGGMAHQESFDPKPYAPVEYRGPMNTIDTNVAGVRVNEMWKQTAKVADKIAICRSMTHGEAAHERGTHNMFTGYRPSPALQFPSMGSVVSHEFGPRNNLPPYVCIPNQPERVRRHGLPQFVVRRFQSRVPIRRAASFSVRDLESAGRRRRHSFRAVADNPGRRQRSLSQQGRSPIRWTRSTRSISGPTP